MAEESKIRYVIAFVVEESKIRYVIAFVRTLKKYVYDIINYCRFSTSRIEEINNKIKVIKRKAYGFHDVEYSSLIIKSALQLNEK